MVNLIFLTVLTLSSPADSLRMETINGKVFIIHQVGEHETLYAVSRRYGTPITAILEFNPKAASGLEVGQLLQVLYVPKAKPQSTAGLHTVAAKETLFSISKLYNVSIDELKAWNNLKDYGLSLGQQLIVKKPAGAKEIVKPQEVKTVAGSHRVEEKETLFSIARKYGVTVQEIKDWNGLTANDVKMGQVLVILPSSGTSPGNAVTTTNPVVTTPPVVVTTTSPNRVEEVKPPLIKEEGKQENAYQQNTIQISENVRGSDEVKEGGLAELIEGTDGNRKYLALHRTAKVGAIVKVRNELNNREVFVRVVGPLPATGVNDRIVIKISKSAYDRLGAIDPKFRVEVTYYK
jgi:LysM repeat protein